MNYNLICVTVTLLTMLLDFVGSDGIPCSGDLDCKVRGKKYCIKRHCYAAVNHGDLCEYSKQCPIGEKCRQKVCSCPSGYKYMRDKCVDINACETDKDCNIGPCSAEGYCVKQYLSGIEKGAIAASAAVVFIAILVYFVWRRNRKTRQQEQLQRLIETGAPPASSIGSVTTTTVIYPPYTPRIEQPVTTVDGETNFVAGAAVAGPYMYYKYKSSGPFNWNNSDKDGLSVKLPKPASEILSDDDD